MPDTIWLYGTFDGLTVSSLFVITLVYSVGIVNLWRRAGIGRGVSRRQATMYYLAILTLVLALMSPLEAWTELLFSAHMLQHLILLIMTPILFVMSKPTVVLLWGLPPNWRRSFARLQQNHYVASIWHVLNHPLILWILHSAILWLWHLPNLYELAVSVTWIHILEHMSFLGITLLYWWSLIHPSHKSHYGISILSLFVTVIQGALLGALLTFAQTPWYSIYAHELTVWGLSTLQDQQLAGAIMWIPSGIVYVSAAGVLLVMWLSQEELA